MCDNTSDLFFMKKAIEQAKIAYSKDEVPIGAVLVCQDKIIAATHNTQIEDKSSLSHAELKLIDIACKKLGKRYLSDCTMYVTIEPCPMCAGAIMAARLHRLCYGAKDKRQGCIDSVYQLCSDKNFYWRPICQGDVLKDECAELMTSFFKSKRKKK